MVDEWMMTGQLTSMKISYMYHLKEFPSEKMEEEICFILKTTNNY